MLKKVTLQGTYSISTSKTQEKNPDFFQDIYIAAFQKLDIKIHPHTYNKADDTSHVTDVGSQLHFL